MSKFIRGDKVRTFKLIEGKNVPTTFLPLNTNIGGQMKTNRNEENRYLTEDQAKHMYKKVESGNIININTIKQENDQDRELNMLDDTSGDINPYRELKANNAEKVDIILSQMEQWFILSNVVNWIQYDRYSKNFYYLNIKAVNKVNHKRRSNIKKKKDKC